MENLRTDNKEISYNENDSNINIQQVIFKYLTYWKWFIVSVTICVIIGLYFYLRADREYLVAMSVFIKENTQSSATKGTALGNLEDLGLIKTTNNINNEIVMFTSPNLMREVARSLEMQTSYYEKGRFRNTEIYNRCPYYASLENIKPDSLAGFIRLEIKKSAGKFHTSGIFYSPEGEIEFENVIDRLPGTINLPNSPGKIYIAKRNSAIAETDEVFEDSEYIVTIDNLKNVGRYLSSTLGVAPAPEGSSALSIQIRVANTQKGVDILNQLVKEYNDENIRENNQTASNTSVFIDERLAEIGSELSKIERKIETYKQNKGIADLVSETKLYMEQTGLIDQKRLDVETQLSVINLIGAFVNDPENRYKLIPNLGVTDQGLNSIILTYNNLIVDYGALVNNANENTPSRQRSERTLDNMRDQIITSISNVKKATALSKQNLDKQKNLTSSRIHSIPVQERDLLELMRQQQINQTLYIFLLQTRIEANIAMASSSDKAKVIADVNADKSPVTPRGRIMLGIAFCIGLALPVLGIFLKDQLQIYIGSKEELEKLSSITVLGEIPKNEESSSIAVSPDNVDSLTELFRNLRNNIKFTLDEPDKKVILISSTVPNEGKTFVCVNLALSFAFSTNKVLLIGLDLRNPQVANTIEVKKERGVSEYLSEQEQDWRKLVKTSSQHSNLDILQAGSVPPNPNELLIKPRLKEMFEEARKIYDIIIVDSAPLGIISDTFLLKNIPDVTLCVVRENVTPKDAVNFLNDVYAQQRLPNMYLVLNDTDLSKNRKQYGKYNYNYTYGYRQDKQ